MNEILSNNLLINIISFSLGIVGISFAIIFYSKNKRINKFNNDIIVIKNSAEDQLEFLFTELNRQLRRRKSSSQYWRRKSYRITIITAVLGATITIFSGIKTTIIDVDNTNNIILFIGVIITIISVWGNIYSPKNSWLFESIFHDKLRALKAEIEFEARKNFNNKIEERVNYFFKEYQATMKEYNES
jgi:hypothetical protein